jgi:receptor protein-tyrosine kinase
VTQQQGFSAPDILGTLRRWLAVLLAAALLGGALGAFAVSRGEVKYQSKARLLVGPLGGTSDSVRTSQSLGATYADLLMSEGLLRSAAVSAGIPKSVDLEMLEGAVQATSNDRTRVLTIVVTWTTPATAQEFTSALVQTAQTFSTRLPTGSDSTADLEQRQGQISIIDPPSLPPAPVPAGTALFAVLAALVSFAAAFGLALIADARRTGLNALFAAAIAGQRVLGTCRLDNALRRLRAPVVARSPRSSQGNDYRMIAAKAELLSPRRRIERFCVFTAQESWFSGEVAANLALAFARDGRQVALVDLSGSPQVFRRMQKLTSRRSVQRVQGFVLESFHVRSGRGEVAVVLTHDVALQADREADGRMVDLLLEVYDLVVVNAPPLLTEPTTAVLAEQADAVSLVLPVSDAPGVTAAAVEAMETLERSGTPLLGAIVAVGRKPRFLSRRPRREHVADKVADEPTTHRAKIIK